jgi:uncharacterized protein YdhG (YjbR/CyaY superfamily)
VSYARGVAHDTIDDYLAELEPVKRATLQTVRERIRAELPDSEECISYGMPAFRLNGKVLAGFGAFTDHLSYFPHSGKVLPVLADLLGDYDWATGTLRFAIDEPLPAGLIAELIRVRREQAFAR